MSDTELGRLMDDVTARPPVDVGFEAVADRVRRRRHLVQRSAAVAVFAAVALVVGVGSAIVSNRPPDSKPSAAPSTEPTVDSSWSQDHWASLSWRTPPGWLPSEAYPDHSRPSNAHIEGPYIGTARLPVTSPSPRTVQGSGVLGSAGPALPDNAVVAWFTYGLHGADQISGTGEFDSDAVKYLPSECATFGAGTTFHEVTHFGSAALGSDLALDGCINADDPAAYRAQLHAVLASVSDSSYPAATSVPTATEAGTIFEHDGVTFTRPAGWYAVPVAAVHSSYPPGLSLPFAMVSDRSMPDTCGKPDQRLDCVLSMNTASILAVVSGGESRNVEGDTGQFGPMNDSGSSSPAAGRCPKGATIWWTWQHLYGLRSHGYLVQITACLSSTHLATTKDQLATLADTVAVRYFPELGAGTATHVITAASASYAPTVCRATFGSGTTGAPISVGDVRSYAVGPSARAAPHAFSGLATGVTAAWCWVRNTKQEQAVAYAAYPGYPPVRMTALGNVGRGDALPTGPLPLP